MPNRRGLRKCERGQALLEFVLTIFTVLVVIFMTIELCSAIYTYVVLSDAVNEGLRYAIVHSADGGVTNTQNVVKDYAKSSLHDTSAMSVSVSPSTWIPGDTLTVNVSYAYLPYMGFMTNPPTMHASAEGVCVY